MFGIANLFLTSCYFSQASSTSYDADILLYIVYRIFKMFIRPKAAAVSGLKVRVFCRRYHTCLQRDLLLFLEAHLCSFAVRAGPSDSFPAIQPKWFACVLQEKLLFQRPGISPRWWKTCLCCRAGDAVGGASWNVATPGCGPFNLLSSFWKFVLGERDWGLFVKPVPHYAAFKNYK